MGAQAASLFTLNSVFFMGGSYDIKYVVLRVHVVSLGFFAALLISCFTLHVTDLPS